jgi:hypothetical protein
MVVPGQYKQPWLAVKHTLHVGCPMARYTGCDLAPPQAGEHVASVAFGFCAAACHVCMVGGLLRVISRAFQADSCGSSACPMVMCTSPAQQFACWALVGCAGSVTGKMLMSNSSFEIAAAVRTLALACSTPAVARPDPGLLICHRACRT